MQRKKIMTGMERREAIIKTLMEEKKPVSGKRLAETFHVSRQVIVQDISLLRASGHEILSTNRGYVLNEQNVASRVFKVVHSDEQVAEELQLIVDFGGCVEDVFVYHKIYGVIKADMNIRCKMDIKQFLDNIRTGKSRLLKNVTSGYHYHTVSAPTEAHLDVIQEQLAKHGFLARLQDYEPVTFAARTHTADDMIISPANVNAPKNGILGCGVATLDIYVNQRRMYPGGNEYNVACNAKKLGARAGFLGVFGDDKAGKILESTLLACGVDTSYSHHEHGSSGYSLVELKEDGDRVFLTWNKEGVTDLYPIQFTDEELAYVQSYEVLSIGRLSTVTLDRIQYLADHDVDISYDFHAVFDDETIRKVAPFIRYAFFSCSHLDEEEIKRVLKFTVDESHANGRGCEIAIGTRGGDSIFAYDGTRFYEQNTFKVDAIDALGAGDSYIGAFLSTYLRLQKNDSTEHEVRVQQSLMSAALHAASVILIEGSIGIGYDVDPEKIYDIIGIDLRDILA